jgi:hypothetical protein
MNASQDAWAGPLALRMIGRYRTQALTYIKVTPGTYSEITGQITNTETSFPAAGAVKRSIKKERDGVQQGHELEFWIEHETVPWPISSNDRVQYLGRKWKVIEIESYGSGGDGSIIGPIYLATQDGKVITTIDGKAFVVQGSTGQVNEFTMYASKIVARAE